MFYCYQILCFSRFHYLNAYKKKYSYNSLIKCFFHPQKFCVVYKNGGSCGLMDRASDLYAKICALHLTHPSAHTFEAVGNQGCGARGAVEHISLVVILCIIVYMTNKKLLFIKWKHNKWI